MISLRGAAGRSLLLVSPLCTSLLLTTACCQLTCGWPLLVSAAAGVLCPQDVIRRQMQVSHLQVAAQAKADAQARGSSSAGSSSSTGSDPHATGVQARGFSSTSSSSNSSPGSSASSRSSRQAAGARCGLHIQPNITSMQHSQPLHAAGSCNSAQGGASNSCSHAAAASRQQSHPSSSHTMWQQQLRSLSSRGGPHQAAAAAVEEPSMVQIAMRLWRQGGMFRGLSINYMKVVPSTAIGFTVYDYTKAYLGLAHS